MEPKKRDLSVNKANSSFTKKTSPSSLIKAKIPTNPLSSKIKLGDLPRPKSPKDSSLLINNHKRANSSATISSKLAEKNTNISFGFHSKTGMSAESPKKVNQDSYFIIPQFAGIPNSYLFGVCDGHGEYGREISNFIKERLPVIIGNDKSLLINTKQVLISSVELLQQNILRNKFDTSFSGSTLNLVLIIENKLFCANVGDSRAVLGKKQGTRWVSVPLSKDHKPDVVEEKERIQASGGRVQAYVDELGDNYGPPRV